MIPSVGIVALSLASKLNEVCYIGINKDFFLEMKDCLHLDQFPAIERRILATFNFEINIVTPFHFLQILVDLNFLFDEFEDPLVPKTDLLEVYLYKILLYFSSSYDINKFRPINVALSVIVCSRKILGINKPLPVKILDLLDIDNYHLSSCYYFCSNLIFNEYNFELKEYFSNLNHFCNST